MPFCRLVWLGAYLWLAPSLAGADVYRCTESGKTVFSDKPCGGGMVKNPEPTAAVSTVGAAPINLQTEADAGRIAVGMTVQQVEQAWGKPADRSTDKDAQGTTELWTYVRKGDTTDIFIKNGAVAQISGPYPAASSAPPPEESPTLTAAALDEQERLEKSDERRFIREGMTIKEVRVRIGPPASIRMSSDLWGVGTYWIYPPTPNDPDTRTTIRFNRDGGHVISVRREIER